MNSRDADIAAARRIASYDPCLSPSLSPMRMVVVVDCEGSSNGTVTRMDRAHYSMSPVTIDAIHWQRLGCHRGAMSYEEDPTSIASFLTEVEHTACVSTWVAIDSKVDVVAALVTNDSTHDVCGRSMTQHLEEGS